ncbi:MAG TPA: class I SAM-dependent methyltransferase [Acidimicrobiales bacterium]|jgi:ubiquinone/menaquinone biosynthesis C-methylase UbiE
MVGFWERAVVPRVVDKACGVKPMRKLRAETVDGLHGVVVEIGFGSGHNLPFMPDDVEVLLAVDPSEIGQKLASGRLADSTVPVEFVGLDGQELPLDSESADAALSTFTLCTIPDVKRALGEVHRVLKSGGELHFLEHGLSPQPKVAKWQHRLTPLQRKLFGGCHFDRPIDTLVADSGLELVTLRNLYVPGPKTPGYIYLGTARKL